MARPATRRGGEASRPMSAALDRESHLSLYMQIAERLRDEIATGRYAESGKLPSEQALVRRFEVSRVTVRLAIGHLINDGLVVRKQGKGTFLAGSLVRHDLRGLKGFYHELVSQGFNPETRLLDFELADPPPEVADALGSGRSRRVLLRRLYSLDGAPICLATTWLPAAAERVTWAEAETYPSYSILQYLLRTPIARAQIAIRGRLAGREYARALEITPKSPLLVLERVSYDDENRPLEHTLFAVNSKSYEFTFTADGPMPINTRIKRAASAS